MAVLVTLPLILLLVIFIAFIVFKKSETSGIKFMLLGITIILFGGIIAVDGNSDLGGFEYLIVLAGMVLSLVGFGKNN